MEAGGAFRWGRERVLGLEALSAVLDEHRARGQVIGLCHGCFDVLHAGHLRHFEAASNLCDVLVVTVTGDRYINKGPNRPVFPAGQRAELIAGLRVVDYSAVNESPSAIRVFSILRPHLFIKGQEYESNAAAVNPSFLAERDAIEKLGGSVAFTYEWTSSSSAAIRRMRGE